jgi:hypothetical protein
MSSDLASIRKDIGSIISDLSGGIDSTGVSSPRLDELEEESPSPRTPPRVPPPRTPSPPPAPKKTRQKKSATGAKKSGHQEVTSPLSPASESIWEAAVALEKKEKQLEKEKWAKTIKKPDRIVMDYDLDVDPPVATAGAVLTPPVSNSPVFTELEDSQRHLWESENQKPKTTTLNPSKAPTAPGSPRFTQLENSQTDSLPTGQNVLSNVPRLRDLAIPTRREVLNELGIFAMSGRMKSIKSLKDINFDAVHSRVMFYKLERTTVALTAVRNIMFSSRESCDDLFAWYTGVCCYLLWLINGESNEYETPKKNDPKYEHFQMIWELLLKYGKFGKHTTANIDKEDKKVKKRIKIGELVAIMNENAGGLPIFWTGGVNEMEDVLFWLKDKDLSVVPALDHPRIVTRRMLGDFKRWIEGGGQGELSQELKKQLGWKDQGQ